MPKYDEISPIDPRYIRKLDIDEIDDDFKDDGLNEKVYYLIRLRPQNIIFQM